MAKQFVYARKKGEGAEFAEMRGTLAVTVLARSDDGHERYARIACGKRFFVRSRMPKGTYPRGNHAPVIVETGLALPAMQLGIGHALAGNMAHRLERRAPISAPHIDKHSIDIKD